MLCDNCNQNEANVKITQILNGKKTEMMLCEECSKKVGLSNMNIEIPIDISSFLGDLISDYDEPTFTTINSINNQMRCSHCNMTYEEFLNTGKFGCSKCYDTFSGKIDLLLRKIQGTDKYIGRKATNKEENNKKKENINNELEDLKEKLKLAIKEERYEDAAIIRDKINAEEKKGK